MDKQIKLADVECVDNRKIEGIEELAANIAAVGLLQPIILVETEDGKYRVVDGRRRFHALEHLKRKALFEDQYVIWSGDQYQEREAAFCANFARQNLTLAEEVEALRHITDTAEGVAKMLGKTPAWVALRRNLANLTGKWVEVLNHPEDYPQWTAAKLEIIARETPKEQKDFEDNIYDHYTLPELKDHFADAHRQISAFIFDTSACKECLKRSDAQGLLFADDDFKDARCLDLACFVHKAVELAKSRLDEPGILYPMHGDGWYNDEDYQLAEDTKAPYPHGYKEVRKPKKGEKPNAVIVCGEGIGEYRVVVPLDKHGATKREKTAAPEEKHEKTVAEREAELAAKRTKLALQKLLERLREKDTVSDWMMRGHYDGQKAHISCLKLAMWYGLRGDEERTYSYSWNKPMWRTEAEFETQVLAFAIERWRNIIVSEIGRTLSEIRPEVGPGICGLLFLDWDDLFMKPAAAEIPEPKALITARIKEQQQANKKAKAKK